MADIDFQPLDFQPEQNQVAPAVPVSDIASNQSNQFDFQPLDFQPIAPATAPHLDFQPLSTPQKTPDMLQDADFQRIGQKYGVDPAELRSLAPYYGAQVGPKSFGEAMEVGAKGAAGFGARSLAFNIPQKIYSKLQSPQMRQALDELQGIGNEQQSPIETASEMVANPLLPGGSTPVRRVAAVAGLGAVQGVGASKEGEELQGAAHGAAFGAALGAGGELLGKVLSAGSRLAPEEQAAIRGNRIDLARDIDQVSQKTEKSEDLLNDLVLNNKETLTSPEVDSILTEQLPADSLEKYMDPATMEGKQLRESAAESGESIRGQLANDIVDSRARDFATELGGKRPDSFEEASDIISKYGDREGAEGLENKYQDFLQGHQADRVISEKGLVATDQPGFFGQTANKLSDNQYVLRHLDDKYGTLSEDALRDLNKANNRYTFTRSDTRKELDNIYREAKKLGVDETIRDSDKIYNALDSGTLKGLTPAEQEITARFRNEFERLRDYANSVVRTKDPGIAPLNIPQVENYVPHLALPVNELIPAVEQKVSETLEDLSVMFDRKISALTDLSPREFSMARQEGVLKDLEDFANWTEQKTGKVYTPADLQSTVNHKLYTREGNIGIESRARSSLERSGEIPDYLLEKNVYKLTDRWALNTFKHLYLRNALDRLSTEGYKLEKLGAGPEAEYVKRIVQDTLGVRKGTAAEGFMQAKIQAGRKLDQLIEKVGPDTGSGKVLTLAKALPDMLYSATRNIYPNSLGYLNIKSALMHSAVSLGRIAPELGGPYGYQTMMRGALKAAANFNRYIERAELLGNIPSEFTRKGEAAIADGIRRSSGMQLAGDALQKLGKAGMILFQTGEKWNRALVLGTADMMANDIVRGSRAAQAALQRFPRSIRLAVENSPKDPQLISDILGKYLNDTTMFNYNRTSMFEYGRSLGPILSTFSKWPTAIAGEALYDVRSKGVLKGVARGIERLVVPFTMLSAADYLLLNKHPGESVEGDVQKKLVGAKGLSGFAPLGALHEFTSGKVFTPPAVDIMFNGIIKPILEKDDAKLSHGFDTMIRSYAPGAGLLRLITDDLVTYATGSRPEGDTFTERTENGLKKIAK